MRNWARIYVGVMAVKIFWKSTEWGWSEIGVKRYRSLTRTRININSQWTIFLMVKFIPRRITFDREAIKIIEIMLFANLCYSRKNLFERFFCCTSCCWLMWSSNDWELDRCSILTLFESLAIIFNVRIF